MFEHATGVISSTMGGSNQSRFRTVSDSWVPQMWKLAPVSAKALSVMIQAQQRSWH